MESPAERLNSRPSDLKAAAQRPSSGLVRTWCENTDFHFIPFFLFVPPVLPETSVRCRRNTRAKVESLVGWVCSPEGRKVKPESACVRTRAQRNEPPAAENHMEEEEEEEVRPYLSPQTGTRGEEKQCESALGREREKEKESRSPGSWNSI